jgi:hypothetical protein
MTSLTDAGIDFTIDAIEVDALLRLLIQAIAAMRGEHIVRAA